MTTHTTQPHSDIDLARLRSHFPALQQNHVFLENAGGSQVPASVSDAMQHYMRSTYVQLDADYDLSQRATDVVRNAHAFEATFMNARDRGTIILGPSSTALCNMLAQCHRGRIGPGDEIVIAECGHETNIGPWVRLAEEAGALVVWWPVDRETTATTTDTLEPLLNERTRFVCFPHVSNLLGEILDVPATTHLAHEVGARVVVDGVAYAPHRAIDVTAWGVDYYFYSTYKVYGPHMAALFGTHDALGDIVGPNHFFIADDDVPYKFEPGGVSHEGCAGLLGLQPYLNLLAGNDASAPMTRRTIEQAFEVCTACELPLQERLIAYLASKPGVRIVGPAHGGPMRVGTISFVHDTVSSRDITLHLNSRSIGMRHGHMYAYRLCQALGIDLADGVVRISLVHYNTPEEIERVIEALDALL